MRIRFTNLGWLFLSCVFIIACKKENGEIVRLIPGEVSEAQQVLIGNALRESAAFTYTILPRNTHKSAYQYLDRLTQMLTVHPEVARRTDFTWRTEIIQNDQQLLAFALPGGNLYLSTGLLNFLESEHELIALLAHELYYVDTDALVNQLENEFGGDVLGDFILGFANNSGQEIVQKLPYLAYESEQVLAADAYAINLLCPFRYEPLGLKSIIEKQGSLDAEMTWLQQRASEPIARIERLIELARPCGLNGIMNAATYQNFKQQLR